MFFAITTKLVPDAVEARAAATPPHRAYLARHASHILAVGPTIGKDGITPIGSVYLFEAASREDAERFVADDPMTVAGVRLSVEIIEWRMAGFDRVYPLKSPK
jgi:uncharacterized protein